jgi:ribosomal protein S12 methylthiotransferase accessory factor
VQRQRVASLAEVLLGPAVVKSYKRGTHRTTTPENTLARVAPIARQIGITRVGNVTGLDRIGIPIAVAVRPNSRSFSVSQGKGLLLSGALASATMEAIELFHGENLRERAIVASHRELSAATRTVSPASLRGTGLPLPEQTEIAWIEGYDLLGNGACWVPWEVVHTDYTLPTSHSGENFLSGTNGLASGNHLSEAISSAICELVERDAVALWHARDISARSRCRLDLASVTDEDCLGLFDLYDKAGITPRLWNVTSDIGIPAFICDIPAQTEDPSVALRRFRGAGCHPNRAIALARAMTEAAQTRLTYIAGIRDDLQDYSESSKDKLGAALLDAMSEAAPPGAFEDIPNHDADDVLVDVRWELECLRAAGVRAAIAVDLTRPEFGIPVVRMIVPGLEWDCTHPRYVPGRRALQAGGRTE